MRTNNFFRVINKIVVAGREAGCERISLTASGASLGVAPGQPSRAPAEASPPRRAMTSKAIKHRRNETTTSATRISNANGTYVRSRLRARASGLATS